MELAEEIISRYIFLVPSQFHSCRSRLITMSFFLFFVFPFNECYVAKFLLRVELDPLFIETN